MTGSAAGRLPVDRTGIIKTPSDGRIVARKTKRTQAPRGDAFELFFDENAKTVKESTKIIPPGGLFVRKITCYTVGDPGDAPGDITEREEERIWHVFW